MPRNRHHHLYQRYNIAKLPGEYFVYRCMLPGCSHYRAHDMIENMDGTCWTCRQSFIMIKELIFDGNSEIEKPICSECSLKKKEEEAKKILEGLKSLMV